MAGQNSTKIYIVSGKRTPFGRFGGSLKDISPVDLSVIAAKSLLHETKIDPQDIGHVVLGNVVPSTTDTMYGGRHLGLKIGVKQETPGVVINRLCGSGIQAIIDAFRMIHWGETDLVLAGGTENMSLVPQLVYGGRFGTKYGPLKTVDMLLDALTDQFCQTPMGITAEDLGEKYQVTRDDCDQFAFDSHQKAAKAYQDNHLQGEIAPVEVRTGVVDRDEHLRADVSWEEMKKLRSNFKKDGLVTAANASGIVDGAATVLVASEEYCQRKNLKPIAEIIDFEVVGVDPKLMGFGPVPAIKNLLEKNKMTLDQIDLIEINEAFAAQTLACQKALEIPQEKLNIWGGAVAMGHPLAASGTRIATTVSRQLQASNGTWGIASACIGGGQGIAMLLKKA